MRRSTVIRLTLLPLLATATLAHAQGAPGAPGANDGQGGPPGMTDPHELSPPGLTPPLVCEDGDQRPMCDREHHGGFVGTARGGFGAYFWSGGG